MSCICCLHILNLILNYILFIKCSEGEGQRLFFFTGVNGVRWVLTIDYGTILIEWHMKDGHENNRILMFHIQHLHCRIEMMPFYFRCFKLSQQIALYN